jgi:hypothetical protein
MIPKKHPRWFFFDDLFADHRFKLSLFTDALYDGVFRIVPGTICAFI